MVAIPVVDMGAIPVVVLVVAEDSEAAHLEAEDLVVVHLVEADFLDNNLV